MATDFPVELDSFINPQPSDSVAIVSHSAQHENANDAITALQIKVGKDLSTDINSIDYRLRALETGSLDPEEVQDLISQLITSGTGISVVYDDENNLLTFSVDTSTIATQEFATQASASALADANSYTDLAISSLSTVYDTLGSAAAAELAARGYADSLSINYDPAGSSNQALMDANEYTDEAVAGLGNSLPNTYVPISSVGQIDGVASLGPDGKIPSAQLDISESIQDVAAQMLVAGTHQNLSVTYDDVNGTLNLIASGGGGGGGASVTVSSNPPLAPNLGDLWLDSDNGKTYAYDGMFWAEIGGDSQIASISSEPPSSPTQGSFWLDSDNARSYIYDGMYWVEV